MTIFKYNGLEIDSNKLSKDLMPSEAFEEIFELCGADVALSLLINMPGNLIQVPTRGMKKIVKILIIKDYDGTTASIRNIARKFSISESLIRSILNEYKINTPAPEQIQLGLVYKDYH